jgi:hypothetical protein
MGDEPRRSDIEVHQPFADALLASWSQEHPLKCFQCLRDVRAVIPVLGRQRNGLFSRCRESDGPVFGFQTNKNAVIGKIDGHRPLCVGTRMGPTTMRDQPARVFLDRRMNRQPVYFVEALRSEQCLNSRPDPGRVEQALPVDSVIRVFADERSEFARISAGSRNRSCSLFVRRRRRQRSPM